MNIIDKIVATFSPERALSRAAAREALATYADAMPTSRDPQILAPGVSGDYALELGRDRRFMVDRVAQLERDNPFAGTLLDRTCELVIGHGYRLWPRTRDHAWNTQFMRLWREFCRKENCDQRGLLSLHTMMGLSFRGYLRDGEAGFIKLVRKGKGILRTLESSEIGTPEGYIRPGKVDGIDLDDNGRPVAFHIYKPNMNVLYSDRRISGDRLTVPADSVIFVARRNRTSMTRGITIFNGIFWALDQVKGSIEAFTVSMRMAACIGLVIKRASPFQLPTTPDPNSSSGVSRTLKLTPGGTIHLLPGEDVTTVTPPAPGAAVSEHIKLLLRIACAPFGLPLELVLTDFGPLNLSSARANVQQALRTAKGHQHDWEHIYNDIADWKALEWMESGELWQSKQWETDDEWRTNRKWIKPKHLNLDPVTDIQADLAAVDAGFKTLGQVAEENEMTLEELLELRKQEKEMLEEAGLEQVKSTLTRDRDPGPGEDKPQDLSQVKASIRAGIVRRPAVRRVSRSLPTSKSAPIRETS